jgi:anti-anti-sigma regulatory factor
MRHDQLQNEDGTSARKYSNDGADSQEQAEAPDFWMIRNQENAEWPFFMDRYSADPQRDGTVEIALKGKLNSTLIPDLLFTLQFRLEKNTVQTVILNLAKVPFISIEGFLGLLVANSLLGLRNARLLLTHPQPQIVRLFGNLNAVPGISVFGNSKEMKNYFDAMQKSVPEA